MIDRFAVENINDTLRLVDSLVDRLIARSEPPCSDLLEEVGRDIRSALARLRSIRLPQDITRDPPILKV